MNIETVGVIGAGVMGRGVSLAVSLGGFRVVLFDRSEEILNTSRNQLRNDLREHALLCKEDSVPAEAVLANIDCSTEYADIADVGLVIENATEKWEVKKPIYEKLDEICRPDAIFAVNTSAIPITRLAGLTKRASQVIGMHFMNPASLKKTVEVIRGYHTSDDTVSYAQRFLKRIGKSEIVVRDSPGFVTNRVMMLTVNEAIFLLQEQVASAFEIDRLFVECFGHKMGPLATADLIGLDTVLLSIEVIYDAFKDIKYRPCPLLCQMVNAGLLGRKSGEGFFNYRQSTSPKLAEGIPK